jgi:hypothetical protein
MKKGWVQTLLVVLLLVGIWVGTCLGYSLSRKHYADYLNGDVTFPQGEGNPGRRVPFGEAVTIPVPWQGVELQVRLTDKWSADYESSPTFRDPFITESDYYVGGKRTYHVTCVTVWTKITGSDLTENPADFKMLTVFGDRNDLKYEIDNSMVMYYEKRCLPNGILEETMGFDSYLKVQDLTLICILSPPDSPEIHYHFSL